MKNNKNAGKAARRSGKRPGLPLIAAAAAALCLLTLVITGPAGRAAPSDSGAAVIEAGGALLIPKADISSSVSFFPVEVDGTRMEVLAVRDSEGTIRTAFNTCQICYSSGRGYYVQQGDALVCQNCRNRFTVDQVEVYSGGCNPWPIFAQDKTETEDAIEISYEFLAASRKIFADWKAIY